MEIEYLADNFPHLQIVLKLLPNQGEPNQPPSWAKCFPLSFGGDRDKKDYADANQSVL